MQMQMLHQRETVLWRCSTWRKKETFEIDTGLEDAKKMIL
jgi:hypothetical protein